jgi:hypothetical protein
MYLNLISGLLLTFAFFGLIVIFVWSRKRDRKIRELTEYRLRNDQEILLFSRGEGVLGLLGLVFLLIFAKGFANDIWLCIFLITAGVFGVSMWIRYALCSRKRPCLEMNKEGITTSSYGSIPWSNVEKISRITLPNGILPIDQLVLKIGNFEKARSNFVLPLRWLHRLNRSHEVWFRLANMSLPGDEVVRYAKSTHRLTKPPSGHSC